jgi:hypothetical protein
MLLPVQSPEKNSFSLIIAELRPQHRWVTFALATAKDSVVPFATLGNVRGLAPVGETRPAFPDELIMPGWYGQIFFAGENLADGPEELLGGGILTHIARSS